MVTVHNLFILSTLNVNDTKGMNLQVDEQSSTITVIEPDRTCVAKGSKEVVKLRTRMDASFLTYIFAKANNFSHSEYEFYQVLLSLTNEGKTDGVRIDDVINACVQSTGKNKITYKRAIDSLITAGVIRYTTNRTRLDINDSFNVNHVIDVANKYIVIALEPSASAGASAAKV